MKQHIISLPHHPKRVIVISLILALAIGVFGYIRINEKSSSAFVAPSASAISENLSPARTLTLGFLASGRIKSVSVKAGNAVKKGDVLATLDAGNTLGAVAQAKAAYEMAKANYQKVINGATGSTIDVAKAAVNTAEINLNEITKQQEILVDNAYRTLLNSSLQAQNISDYSVYNSPTVSGTYDCKKEGFYNIKTYSSTGGISVNYSGIEEGTLLLTDVPRPMGSCGLFLSFDQTKQLSSGLEFNIQIPNKSAPNYNLNNNAYKLALQTKEQSILLAQAALDQANSNLQLIASGARREDIAIAQAQVENSFGSLQIANAAYNNTIITAPTDGVVTAVYIAEGQIAASNAAAIEFISN